MTKHLIRIEAINLSSFVFDNNDLSTMRGASLQLLAAIKEIKHVEIAHQKIGLKSISVGASIGLYEVDLNGETSAEQFVKYLQSWLDDHAEYRHATFAVTAVPFEKLYSATEEKTLALARWSQWSSPTVLSRFAKSETKKSVTSAKNRACAIDGLRPAIYTDHSQDRLAVSASTMSRRTYGRKQKRTFYEAILKAHGHLGEFRSAPQFTNDFQQLAEPSSPTDWTNLQGKIAVLYFDGNSFNKQIREVAKTVEKQRQVDHVRQLDKELRSSREKFLCDLLVQNAATGQNPAWHDKNHNFQIETLLWGGDEIMWVVPAWQGWNLAMRFFERWQLTGFPGLSTLTHAGGLVFCHMKAPIHEVRGLAYNLAEQCKGTSRDQNLLAYEVLESFDHTGSELEKYRFARTPPPRPHAKVNAQVDRPMRYDPLAPMRERKPQQPAVQRATTTGDRLALTLAQMQCVHQLLCGLRSTPDYPRGRMRDCVMASLEPNADYESVVGVAESICQHRSITTHAGLAQQLKAAKQAFLDDTVMLWRHVSELWDYCGFEGLNADTTASTSRASAAKGPANVRP